MNKWVFFDFVFLCDLIGEIDLFYIFLNSKDLVYKEWLKLFIFLNLVNLESFFFDIIIWRKFDS